MIKRSLFEIFVSGRTKIGSIDMTINAIILYFIAATLASLYSCFPVAALLCFTKMSIWICNAWIWADIIFFSDYCLLKNNKDRAASEERTRAWARI